MRFSSEPAVLVVAPVAERREELVKQVAVGRVDLDHVEARARRARAAARRRRRPARSRPSRGARRGIAVGEGDRARRDRLPAAAAGARSRRPPRQGTSVEALRPAWASWMPGGRALRREERARWRPGGGCSSYHMPPSSGLIRPSGDDGGRLDHHQPGAADGAAGEVHDVPVVREPVRLEYWHIGDMTMRLRSSRPRRRSGEKRRSLSLSCSAVT